MEELMLKLAELLEVTVDAAIELYPLLRSQFVWYKILTDLSKVNIAFTIGGLILLIAGALQLDTVYDDEDKKSARKIIKIGVVLLVVAVIAWISLIFSKNLIAPDIVFIKDVLN